MPEENIIPAGVWRLSLDERSYASEGRSEGVCEVAFAIVSKGRILGRVVLKLLAAVVMRSVSSLSAKMSFGEVMVR